MKLVLPCIGFTQVEKVQGLVNLAKEMNMVPHVVTEKENSSLVQYCLDNNVSLQLLDPKEQEWPYVVLQSCLYWEEKNLVLLPGQDIKFSTVEGMLTNLTNGTNAALGVRPVDNQNTTTVVNSYFICRNPDTFAPGTEVVAYAFHKSYGIKLFSTLMTKNKSLQLENVSFHTM